MKRDIKKAGSLLIKADKDLITMRLIKGPEGPEESFGFHDEPLDREKTITELRN